MNETGRLAAEISVWTGARAETMAELLGALVSIPSPTGDVEGNGRCLEILEAGFGVLDFVPTRVPAALGRERLVLARPGAPGAPRVVLIGHTDTVFPAQGPFRGFRIEGGKARGPGVADMKGGLVVMLTVVQALKRLGRLDAF